MVDNTRRKDQFNSIHSESLLKRLLNKLSRSYNQTEDITRQGKHPDFIWRQLVEKQLNIVFRSMKVSKLYLGSMRQGGGLVRVLTVSRARPRLKSLIVMPMKKTGMEMRSPMKMT